MSVIKRVIKGSIDVIDRAISHSIFNTLRVKNDSASNIEVLTIYSKNCIFSMSLIIEAGNEESYAHVSTNDGVFMIKVMF